MKLGVLWDIQTRGFKTSNERKEDFIKRAV